jgi:hypothetical protein
MAYPFATLAIAMSGGLACVVLAIAVRRARLPGARARTRALLIGFAAIMLSLLPSTIGLGASLASVYASARASLTEDVDPELQVSLHETDLRRATRLLDIGNAVSMPTMLLTSGVMLWLVRRRRTAS